jgi:hypothetical protein
MRNERKWYEAMVILVPSEVKIIWFPEETESGNPIYVCYIENICIFGRCSYVK